MTTHVADDQRLPSLASLFPDQSPFLSSSQISQHSSVSDSASSSSGSNSSASSYFSPNTQPSCASSPSCASCSLFATTEATSTRSLSADAQTVAQPISAPHATAVSSIGKNPRRTQQVVTIVKASDGNVSTQYARPPPLVRQSQRKINFVERLVDTTAQMVQTIWPQTETSQAHLQNGQARQSSRMDLRFSIQEVLRRSKTSHSTLQVALLYLLRIRPNLPKPDAPSPSADPAIQFSLQCGLRMFIAALMLASKYLQDRNYSNRAWAKICFLTPWDINTNERAFLSAIGWNLHVPEELFNKWTAIVVRYSHASPMQEELEIANMSLSSPLSLPLPSPAWKDIVLSPSRCVGAEADGYFGQPGLQRKRKHEETFVTERVQVACKV